MRMRTVVSMTAVAIALVSGCAIGSRGGVAVQPSTPGPARLDALRPKAGSRAIAEQKEPRLDPAQPQQTAVDLIAWAAASGADQRETVRHAIQQISDDEPVVRALCSEALQGRLRDHSRTLIALAIVGETKSDAGERCLTEFVRLPFPASGRDVEGEILEQTALATLQAKAVAGLAYRRTASADRIVLALIREHPSRIVRAEAISAYLWNRGDSAEAKAELAAVVRPDEKIFLDRVRRVPGETAATFNPKLRAFLEAHPEAQAPAPVKGKGRQPLVCPADCVSRPIKQSAPASGGRGE